MTTSASMTDGAEETNRFVMQTSITIPFSYDSGACFYGLAVVQSGYVYRNFINFLDLRRSKPYIYFQHQFIETRIRLDESARTCINCALAHFIYEQRLSRSSVPTRKWISAVIDGCCKNILTLSPRFGLFLGHIFIVVDVIVCGELSNCPAS